MVGNRLKGGSSDLMERPYQIPTNFRSARVQKGKASYDSDSDIDDLGAIHSKRRGKKGIIGGNERVKIRGSGVDDPIVPNNILPPKILKKMKRIKEAGGKKSKNLPEPKSSSKLLKIFN
jgi:hypothetical protein